ncbi:uncharacterized protein LY89DRAFT_681047 [Mollisia scopiformis]|uniref:2EXR domain-containing protein n=1 Tax=Mollisia scopiformis TaxID=149040 RepID=A0A194XN43_MOLSC|nr:uncharacterized protein LY89DRAFT_681047 [Mollisia scopiformis]KUJ21583.1 hypothetical protein LY89DRAFT_681047 [Mollisia scopiformis]
MATQAPAVQPPKPKRKRRSTAIQPSITDFEYFPKLPYELRSMIWKIPCFVPRDVDIWMRSEGEVRLTEIPERTPGERFLPNSYHTKSVPPIILQVNQESRREGLRWYRLEFGINMKCGGVQYILPPKIYINWSVDLLCVKDSNCISTTSLYSDTSFSKLCRDNRLKTLALNVKNFKYWGPIKANSFGIPLRKMSLSELIFFDDASSTSKANYRFEAFQKTKRNGTLSKVIQAPGVLLEVSTARDMIITSWDTYEADLEEKKKNGVEGLVTLPPRPTITLMRFITPRPRKP